MSIKRGYYLVRQSDNSRHFISAGVNVKALERVADNVLSEKVGFDYWIDYCHGYDIRGVIAWENIDCTDAFI